jgi:hypothetical protein
MLFSSQGSVPSRYIRTSKLATWFAAFLRKDPVFLFYLTLSRPLAASVDRRAGTALLIRQWTWKRALFHCAWKEGLLFFIAIYGPSDMAL